MLTLKRLKEVLHYDPITGIFTWKTDLNVEYKAGLRAGWETPKGYRRIQIDGKSYGEARLAFFYMNGRWPFPTVDHENRKRNDNRYENLREASRALQTRNRGVSVLNRSGVIGVYFYRRKWKAQFNPNKRIGLHNQLGSFSSKELAIFARKSAEENYFLYLAENGLYDIHS